MTTKATQWRIVNQTQSGHLGRYCDLNHAIRYESGQFQIRQRIQDAEEGYRLGQERANLIATALEMRETLEEVLKSISRDSYLGRYVEATLQKARDR